MNLNVLLISTYEMGRQPFGLASPAAWLREAGAAVGCVDLSVDTLNAEVVQTAELVAFYVPMHMGTRMAVPVIEQVHRANPRAHLCCYGLYAPVNEEYLRGLGVETILGGEFESGLVALVEHLSLERNGRSARGSTASNGGQPQALISVDRQEFLVPDRSSLSDLTQYAQLRVAGDRQQLVGYTEASRGCKHLCRHCPIVPVYGGRFRIVQRGVVLADIRQQVAAGARHITFGDPDFFNGPGHALPLVTELHREFPDLTYDVTIKVEHLLKHEKQLEKLKKTGCLFVTTAVESFDDRILSYFDKQHTLADFETVLRCCREIELLLVPTFVAFTPWTTLAGYCDFLAEIVRLGLVDQVSPIQCAIRLLIPPGSKLLELPEMQDSIGSLDERRLSYVWHNPDPRLDTLQADLEVLVQSCAAQEIPRREVFRRIWQRTFQEMGDPLGQIPLPDLPPNPRFVPYLTEPWYC